METSWCCVAVTSLFVFVACGPRSATMVAELPNVVDVGKDAERFTLSGENTLVEAEVSAAATFTISFSESHGILEIVPRDPTRSRLQVDVDMSSASSTPEVVADIAMSGSFLDAGAFPTAKLSSRQVTKTDDGGYEMLGELTLHGVTRGMRMPVAIQVTDCAIDVVVAFSFDRHAFEIQNEESLESLVADTVAVRFVLKIERPCPSSK